MSWHSRLRLPVFVAIYLTIAGLWTYLDDAIIAQLVTDPVTASRLQIVKVAGFVAFMAAALALIFRHEGRVRAAHEQALRESEETHRTLIEVETDALLLIENETGCLLTANPAAAELYGYPVQELLGLRDTDLSAEPAEGARVTSGTSNGPNAIVRTPLRYHKKRDGTVFPVEITDRFFTWRSRPVHLAIVRDITERQQAEATRARYQLLAKQARDIVLLVRRDGRILEANQAAVLAYGYALEELARLHIQELRAPETQGLTAAQLARADAEGILFETVHRRKDGTTFPVEVSSRGADLAGERVLFSIVRDITDRKQAEQALASRTRHLEAVRVVTEEITRELDLPRLLRLLIARAAALAGATSGTVYLWDPTERVLVPRAWYGLGDWQETIRLQLGEAVAGTVAETGQTLVVNEYRSSPYAHPLTLQNTGLTASLGEPLRYREELIGAITLGHEGGRTFTADDQEVLRLFAGQASIAIQNARLYAAAQRELRQREAAEATLRKIVRAVEQSSSIVLITDLSGVIEYVNPKFTEVTGYTFDEVRGRTPRILKSGHTSASEYAQLWATLTAGAEWLGEFRNRRKDGTLYWEAASISPVRNPEGVITHYVAVKEDITARKAADAALRRYASQLEAVRATTTDVVRELDLDRLLELITARAAALLEVTHGALHLWDEAAECLVTRAIAGYDAWRGTVTLRLGEGVIGTVAQRRIGLIENDYRASPFAAPVFLERSQTTAMVAAPLVYRDRLVGVLAVTNDGTARRFEPHDLELLHLFADQAALALENARLFQAEHDRRAQLEAVRAVGADITQELTLTKVLQLVAQRACQLTGATAADIDLWDAERQLLLPEVSYGHAAPRPRTPRRLGEGAMGLVAESRQGIILNDYRASPVAHPETVAHTIITASLVEPLLYRDALLGVIGVDHEAPGRIFSLQDQATLRLFADQAAIAIANARLYTTTQEALHELRQAQEELVRTEKLRGLGQMAAGIAHEMNNILATILGQTEMLRLRTWQPEVEESLQTLQTAATDGAQVVRRLQDFARQQRGSTLSACDLSQLVSETLEITRPHWREEPHRRGVRIEAVVDLAGLPLIQGNPAEIREILTNLIFNAVDAMPNGGALRFTGNAVAEAPASHVAEGMGDGSMRHAVPAERTVRWVELAVADCGIGMTEEVRRRVFDPFFTTKGLHGTGLGLSVVYGIMERHGGQIDVTSIPGQGTTFRLRFRPAPQSTPPPARRSAPGPVPGRRILVVDDDAPVRRTLVNILRRSGQEVFEAESGSEALRWLETTAVDLVLTDLGMPDITGWDVARAAKARDPNLPVVLITGWGDQVEAEAPASIFVDRVLAKPVPRSAVLAVIAELTGSP